MGGILGQGTDQVRNVIGWHVLENLGHLVDIQFLDKIHKGVLFHLG